MCTAIDYAPHSQKNCAGYNSCHDLMPVMVQFQLLSLQFWRTGAGAGRGKRLCGTGVRTAQAAQRSAAVCLQQTENPVQDVFRTVLHDTAVT